jgi:hypothetical protein
MSAPRESALPSGSESAVVTFGGGTGPRVSLCDASRLSMSTMPFVVPS